MKKFIKTADVILSVICVAVFLLISVGAVYVPSSITFYDGRNEADILKIYHIKEISKSVITVSNVSSEKGEAQVSLFGIIPVGKISSAHSERKYVYAGGELIGIRMYTEGLMVVGVESVDTEAGRVSPAADCGIQSGDIITRADGEPVTSSSDFGKLIAASGGKEVNVTVHRDNRELVFALTPVYSETEQKYRCGIWLRDSTAGIGTLTFSDSRTNMFASLGHAICDSDTNHILPVGNGDILGAAVNGCTPGTKGTTGQVHGSFTAEVKGKLLDNNEFGVYGTCTDAVYDESVLYPVASQAEIETGHAQIISSVTAEGKKMYDIEIERITYSNDKISRSIVLRVTDPELLALTGGIVQGMSGSPIIQNGMLVGAVTHVFLNDPACGYGIFAETMLDEAEQIYKNTALDGLD